MLDQAGFQDAVISASNDLDEYLIENLKAQGATITSWGVGTNLITSKNCPAFGGVYKLAAIQNKQGEFLPKIKLSENTEKVTNPGNKTIYRIYEKDSGKIKADLICLEGETFDCNKDLRIFDPLETWKYTNLKGGEYTMRKLPIQVFDKGRCIYQTPRVLDIQKYCEQEKDTLWNETKRFVNPNKVYVDLSDKLFEMKRNILRGFSK